MEVNITARHCSIPDSIRDRTAELIRRLERIETRTTSVSVSFEADHGLKNVDARVAVAGRPPLIAHAAAPTFRGALDVAAGRIRRQLRRDRQRGRRRRADVVLSGQDAQGAIAQ